MQPLPANQHQFEVTFSLDQNGLLKVMVNHINENKAYTAGLPTQDHRGRR